MRFRVAATSVVAATTILVGATSVAEADTGVRPFANQLELGPAILQPGERGAVDIGFENLGGRSGSVEGSVTVIAPAGTTFPATREPAPGSYQNPGWSRWLTTSALRLTDPRLNAARTEATYTLEGAPKFDALVRLRFAVPVDVAATADQDSSMRFSARGTRDGGPGGSWSVNGSTPTTIGAGLRGDTGPSTPLPHHTSTAVPVRAHTATATDSVDSEVEITAPAGTTLRAGQETLAGWYEIGGVRKEAGAALTDGVRSDDGTSYTYRWVTEEQAPGWSVPAGTPFGWEPVVVTDDTTPSGDGQLRAEFAGDTAQGRFATAATTPTSVPQRTDVLIGATGPITDLDRTDATEVPAAFRSTTTMSAPRSGNVVFTAPEHTRFASASNIRGSYRQPGSTRFTDFDADQLVAGVLASDSRSVTYQWADGQTWSVPSGTELRFAPTVTVATDSPGGSSSLRADATGTTSQGTFSAEATTPTVVDELPVLDPVTLRNTTVVRAWDNVLRGTAEPDATLTPVDRFGNPIASAVSVDHDGNWSAVVRIASNASELRVGFRQTVDDITEDSPLSTLPAVDAPSVTTTTTTVTPGVPNQFNGTAPANATFSVVNRYGTALVDGTSTVDPDGSWHFDRVVDRNALTFEFRLQLAHEGYEVRTPIVVLPTDRLAPATVSTTSVVPGTLNDFDGTATPNATLRIVNRSGTELVDPVDVGSDGSWHFERLVDHRAEDFRFVIIQERAGVSLPSGLFVIPARTA